MPTTIPPIVITYTADRSDEIDDACERMVSNTKQAVERFGSRGRTLVAALSPVRTGYMKSQVKDEVSRGGFQAMVYVDGNLHLETGAFYAIYVEHGTRNRAPNPFFRPGVRQAKKLFVAEMRNVFKT